MKLPLGVTVLFLVAVAIGLSGCSFTSGGFPIIRLPASTPQSAVDALNVTTEAVGGLSIYNGNLAPPPQQIEVFPYSYGGGSLPPDAQGVGRVTPAPIQPVLGGTSTLGVATPVLGEPGKKGTQ